MELNLHCAVAMIWTGRTVSEHQDLEVIYFFIDIDLETPIKKSFI